jgi:5-methylcytosine-specific restriction endonuclease McrA
MAKCCSFFVGGNMQTYHNQYTDGSFDRIANCQRVLTAANPNFEYVGGFVDMDSPVDIRCKACGHEFTRSMIGLRHLNKKHECPNCKAERKRREAEENKKQKQELAEQRKVIAYQQRLGRAKWSQYEMATCGCCGGLFVMTIKGTEFCSDVCRNKVGNAIKKDRRIRRMKEVVVDKNITLEELYKRSNGRCALCGELCDYNDYYYRGNVFIAGNNYPSIDHIVPLSKGGLHSWKNIQLAHRSCNVVKSNTV